MLTLEESWLDALGDQCHVLVEQELKDKKSCQEGDATDLNKF